MRFLTILMWCATCAWGVVAQTPLPSESASPKYRLKLPTDNDGLLRGDGPGFYMFVDRNFENQKTSPWEGGQYGYVRGPVRMGGRVVLMAFHEGLDIAPMRRSSTGEPLDEVRSMAQGEVVHASDVPGASNYGRYIVVRHDWGQGPFYSLYAHLSRINVQPGQQVVAGTPLGIMGYTGAGLDKRRSHLHVELNLMLSSRFPEWHDKHFRPSPNKHGHYNGLNLSGMNLAELLLGQQRNPNLSPVEFVQSIKPTWKLLVPRKGELELLKRYPWLGGQGDAAAAPSWEISLSDSGLPLRVLPSQVAVDKPRVSWVEHRALPHSTYTRGYVGGSAGGTGMLTASGLRFAELLTGDFQAPPTVAVPVEVSPTPRVKGKR